jgi:hypothetical protein
MISIAQISKLQQSVNAAREVNDVLQSSLANARSKIEVIHTLGPLGTNLAGAALIWLQRNAAAVSDLDKNVILHSTVEDAVANMPENDKHGLMTCAVYPLLHDLVFKNIVKLQFIDSFIYPTFSMVLASVSGLRPLKVATHPAPSSLVPKNAETIFVNSNSQAALDCAAGLVDGCITTAAAATMHELKVVTDFGPVPMVFTLHGFIRQA